MKLTLQIATLILIAAASIAGIICSCTHYQNQQAEIMLKNGYRWVPSTPPQSDHWEKEQQ